MPPPSPAASSASATISMPSWPFIRHHQSTFPPTPSSAPPPTPCAPRPPTSSPPSSPPSPSGPLHIHAAEQVQEVADVEAWLGARPVAFLLDRVGLSARWTLIHCTQMTEAETAGLAASGATAGLCPITEGNLGDGIFPGAAYRAAGGSLGIGSDSNIRISLAEELRGLEYSQRLALKARNVLAEPGASVGATLHAAALAGGARALARPCGAIVPGALADLVAIDRDDLTLSPLTDGALLDGWIFAAGDRVVRAVWSAGRAVVRDGRHTRRDAIVARYRTALRAVLARA